MVPVGLDYRFCELSFNSVLMLQIVSKCRSVLCLVYCLNIVLLLSYSVP